MKVLIYLVLFAIIFVIAIALGTQNPQVVNFNYLIAQSELSLSVLLSIFLLLGFVIASLAFAWSYLHYKWHLVAERRKNRKLTQQLRQLEEQVARESVS